MDLKLICDLLKEIRKEQQEQSKSLARHSEHLINIEQDVAVNTEDLKEHMKRSLANEEGIKVLRDTLKNSQKQLEKHNESLNELQKHHEFRTWIQKEFFRIMMTTSLIVTIIGGAIAIVTKIKGIW